MLVIKNKSAIIFLGALLMPFLTGCSSDEFENKAFFATSKGFKQEIKVKTDERQATATCELRASTARPVDENLTISFRYGPELLDTYREAHYDENVQLLSEEYFDLGDAAVEIQKGESEGVPMYFRLKDLDKLDLSDGKSYLLPVQLADAGNLPVLKSASVTYFVVSEAALIEEVAGMKGNRAWPVWNGSKSDLFKDMEHFTIETLVYNDEFKNEIHTIVGIEDRFLIRIGDSKLKKNQLNVAYAEPNKVSPARATITNDDMMLDPGKWYHIAVTFDGGAEKAETGAECKVYINGEEVIKQNCFTTANEISTYITSVDFSTEHSEEEDAWNHPEQRCLWVGYSYSRDRGLLGRISELRFWNRVLSGNEIKSENHFYKIRLDMEEAKNGLVGYWKFNEGEGHAIKDYSGNGNDMTADSDLIWYKTQPVVN